MAYRSTDRAWRALSLRQPWAWLVVHGGKDIENRRWHLPRSMRDVPFLIHAAKGMTKKEYDEAVAFAEDSSPGIVVPPYDDLRRGGIVGAARISGCLCPSTGASRPWWIVWQHGFRLRDVTPLPFVPCVGMLGFFEVPREVLVALDAAIDVEHFSSTACNTPEREDAAQSRRPGGGESVDT